MNLKGADIKCTRASASVVRSTYGFSVEEWGGTSWNWTFLREAGVGGWVGGGGLEREETPPRGSVAPSDLAL